MDARTFVADIKTIARHAGQAASPQEAADITAHSILAYLDGLTAYTEIQEPFIILTDESGISVTQVAGNGVMLHELLHEQPAKRGVEGLANKIRAHILAETEPSDGS